MHFLDYLVLDALHRKTIPGMVDDDVLIVRRDPVQNGNKESVQRLDLVLAEGYAQRLVHIF